MFIVEEMYKVRSVIEQNRNWKLTKHKKMSNNTIIKIDHCSPLEIVKLQKNLLSIAALERIEFVEGKGNPEWPDPFHSDRGAFWRYKGK